MTTQLRADAERNVAAILDAAVELIADRPNVSMAEVAKAAMSRAIAESTAKLDEARIDEGPAPDALRRVIDASWSVLDRYRRLAEAPVEGIGPEQGHAFHAPLIDRVRKLIERGQTEGVFRTDLPVDWLVASVFGLVHTARDEVNAGRLAAEHAPTTLQATITAALDSQR
jgi:hypothetical protein